MNRIDVSIRELKNDQAQLKELYQASQSVGRTWQAVGAICGLAGGCVTAMLGMLLSAGAWTLGDESGGMWPHVMGSILLLSTIPLLIGGAHCLDLLERHVAKGAREKSAASVQTSRLSQSTHSRIVPVIALLLLLCWMPSQTRAQQTVFNVPTTDVLAAGKIYFELDISARPFAPKFSTFVPRLVVGAGRNVEVGLNVTGNIQPGADSTTLVPAVKWRIYRNENHGWAIVVGDNLYIPVRNSSYNIGSYSYVMTQKSFKSGTRIGFGGNFFSRNTVAANANRAGGQFTFEQPLTRKLNVNADWFTGKHANGYLTIGAAYRMTDRLTGVAAYSIGNATKGNHFLYFEVGYNVD